MRIKSKLSMGPPPPRYESLDHWRGLACLLVIGVHATYYWPEGQLEPLRSVFSEMWIGVPIFFVISGYCIAASCDAASRRGDHGIDSFVRYFIKRWRRIFPPFWALLAIALIAVMATEHWVWRGLFADDVHPIPSPESLSLWQWLGNLTLTETWRFHLIGEARGFFVGHAWTLCYEEQFYVVAALILAVFRRRLLLGFTLFSLFIWLMQESDRYLPVPQKGTLFDGRWWLFATGIAIFYVANALPRWRWPVLLMFMAVAVGNGVREAVGAEGWLRPIEFAAGFGFGAAILALHPFDRQISKSSFLRPIGWLGTMCYSLYLVHWPITKAISHAMYEWGFRSAEEVLLLTLPLCAVASIAAAYPFHIWIERPFMHNHHRRSTPSVETGTVPAIAGVQDDRG